MSREPSIRGIVGAVLRERRAAGGLTQERLGYLAGLHRNYVGSAERGERNVSIEALERWLGALDTSWEAFGREVDARSRNAQRPAGRAGRKR